MKGLKCNCGHTIDYEDIDREIGVSDAEYGDEYTAIEVICENCGKEHRYSEWGEYDTDEMIKFLQEEIDEYENNNINEL
jgi:hypothetical protein